MNSPSRRGILELPTSTKSNSMCHHANENPEVARQTLARRRRRRNALWHARTSKYTCTGTGTGTSSSPSIIDVLVLSGKAQEEETQHAASSSEAPTAGSSANLRSCIRHRRRRVATKTKSPASTAAVRFHSKVEVVTYYPPASSEVDDKRHFSKNDAVLEDIARTIMGNASEIEDMSTLSTEIIEIVELVAMVLAVSLLMLFVIFLCTNHATMSCTNHPAMP